MQLKDYEDHLKVCIGKEAVCHECKIKTINNEEEANEHYE